MRKHFLLEIVGIRRRDVLVVDAVHMVVEIVEAGLVNLGRETSSKENNLVDLSRETGAGELTL